MAQDEPAMLKMTLEKPSKRLTGPWETRLTVLGKVDSLLEVGDRCHHEAVYVVEGQRSSLLSKRACEELNLVEVPREVYQVRDGHPEFRKELPALFTGLKTTESHLKGRQSQSVFTRHRRFLTLCNRK